ncbi:MAG TPA: metal-dependent hydrolase [Pyrinomonadaceae bacterium]|nr:metal-dependent hydrolase [Pyrinomonadaceae bacterium]
MNAHDFFSCGFASAIGSASGLARLGPRFWILGAFCAILPDLDVIAFPLGVSYASTFGHRGFTHSIFFAVMIGMIITALFFRDTEVAKWKLALYFAAATLSHPLLDMLTDGGLGVALLAPLVTSDSFFHGGRSRSHRSVSGSSVLEESR